MPPHRRASTPHPTQPPPLPLPAPPEQDECVEPALERAERRLKPLHALLAVAIALVGAGAAWASWDHTVVKHSELDKVSTTAASNLAAATEGTSYQLHALQVDAQSVRERLARVEASLNAVGDDMKWLREQLMEVAKVSGARIVKDSNP